MGTEKREMTAIEAVEITKNLLGDIALPAKYRTEIGIIGAAMDNLNVIKMMIECELKKAAAHDSKDEELEPPAEEEVG